MVEEADGKNVLVLIDESCTATNSLLGKPITQNVANYLAQEHPNAAVFMIAHYEGIQSLAEENPRVENYKVDVIHDKEGNFRFTYKVVPGVPSRKDKMVAIMHINKRKKFPKKLREAINEAVKREKIQ